MFFNVVTAREIITCRIFPTQSVTSFFYKVNLITQFETGRAKVVSPWPLSYKEIFPEYICHEHVVWRDTKSLNAKARTRRENLPCCITWFFPGTVTVGLIHIQTIYLQQQSVVVLLLRHSVHTMALAYSHLVRNFLYLCLTLSRRNSGEVCFNTPL